MVEFKKESEQLLKDRKCKGCNYLVVTGSVVHFRNVEKVLPKTTQFICSSCYNIYRNLSEYSPPYQR